MAGQGTKKPKGRTEPLPPWAQEVPRGARKLCVNNHGGQRVWPLGQYEVLENTQGQTLEKPIAYCGTCLRRMEKARQRHDEHAGSIRQRNLDAVALTKALELFEETTGVDLKRYADLAEGRFHLGAREIENLAEALEEAYEGRTAEGLEETMSPGVGPNVGSVLTFRRRVPGA